MHQKHIGYAAGNRIITMIIIILTRHGRYFVIHF
jgi:hypothetical protein